MLPDREGTALAVLLRPRLNPAALAAEVRLTIQADCEQDPALTLSQHHPPNRYLTQDDLGNALRPEFGHEPLLPAQRAPHWRRLIGFFVWMETNWISADKACPCLPCLSMASGCLRPNLGVHNVRRPFGALSVMGMFRQLSSICPAIADRHHAFRRVNASIGTRLTVGSRTLWRSGPIPACPA